jgi:hypothetical protein
MTARNSRELNADIVRDRLAALLPGLSETEFLSLLEAAKASSGKPLRDLSLHLAGHPDALNSGNPDCPPSLVRLAHVLYKAGYVQVVRPPCSGCGRTLEKLPARGPAGRLCGNCAQRKYVGDCARCGRPNVRLVARRAEGVICQACYRFDPDVIQPCAECGRVRMAVQRREDGSVLCQGCWEPPAHRCSLCGVLAQAVTMSADGPVCGICYDREFRPRRRCSRCGKVRPVSLRAVDGQGDVCRNCYQGPQKVCAVCKRTRACHKFGPDREWTCASCRLRTADTCARCGRLRPVHVRWPIGPVCSGCYAAVLDSSEQCSLCGTVAPLVGRDAGGASLCGPCSGLSAHLCRRCGWAGRRYANEVCARCVLDDRLNCLMAVDGTIPEELRPVYESLMATTNPRGMIWWLSRSPNARLLASLAADGGPLTHELLDDLPPSRHELYVRQMLVHTGVLPSRDEDTERIPAWLEQQLAGRPAAHADLLRPFVNWHVLRLARRRSRQRHYPASAKKYLRTKVRTALDLLAWLDERRMTIDGLTQEYLDIWLSEGSASRYYIRYFIKWLQSRGVASGVTVPRVGRGYPVALMDEKERWDVLEACLTDESMPIDVRAAGALVLLYGMTLYRVGNLRAEHLTRSGEDAYLFIGHQPVLLPPRLAHLLEQLARERVVRSRLDVASPGTQWLFPGLSPGLPVGNTYLQSKLLRYGISSRSGRNTALVDLAADLPSPVVADLFGLHINTAVRWAKLATRDWTAYVAERTADPPNGMPATTVCESRSNRS